MLEAATPVALRLRKERKFRLKGRETRSMGKKIPAEGEGISGRRERKIRLCPQGLPTKERRIDAFPLRRLGCRKL